MLRVRRVDQLAEPYCRAWNGLQGVMVNFTELHNIIVQTRASPIQVRPQSGCVHICYCFSPRSDCTAASLVFSCELPMSAVNTGIRSRNLKPAAQGGAPFANPLIIRSRVCQIAEQSVRNVYEKYNTPPSVGMNNPVELIIYLSYPDIVKAVQHTSLIRPFREVLK